MPWARFDDRFNSHPKVLAAGPLAIALHMRAIIYSAQYLTDGVIRKRTLRHILSWEDDEEDFGGNLPDNLTLATRLLHAGLWDEAPGGAGWVIHDYLDYNPSKADAERLQQSRVDAGRAGGRAKARARSPEPEPEPSKPLAVASSPLAVARPPLAARYSSPPEPEPGALPIPEPPPEPEPEPPESPPLRAERTASDFAGNVEYRVDDASEPLASAKQLLGSRLPVATDAPLANACPVPEPVPVPNKRTPPVASNAAGPTSGLRRSPEERGSPVVMIPLKAGEHPVYSSDVVGWTTAYPGVDVGRALIAMREWCLSNPRRRKTRSGVRRFITGWLGRDVSSGNPQQRSRGRSSFADVTKAAMEWASGADSEDRIRGSDD